MPADSTIIRKIWLKGSATELINLDQVMKIRHDTTNFWVFIHHAIGRAAGVTGSDNAVQVYKYADLTASTAAYDAIVAVISQNGYLIDISAF